MESKKTNPKKLAIVLAGVFLIVFALGIFYFSNSHENKNKGEAANVSVDFFSDNQCACLERNLLDCSSGYELKENVCVNQTLKTYTNPLLKCSKYDCSGATYTFDNETDSWWVK